jgi:hypothetical protein
VALRGSVCVENVTDWTFTTLITQTARLAPVSQPFNLVVTNVLGPQFPLDLPGFRILAAYPLVPIFRRQAVGIALLSYDGGRRARSARAGRSSPRTGASPCCHRTRRADMISHCAAA